MYISVTKIFIDYIHLFNHQIKRKAGYTPNNIYGFLSSIKLINILDLFIFRFEEIFNFDLFILILYKFFYPTVLPIFFKTFFHQYIVIPLVVSKNGNTLVPNFSCLALDIWRMKLASWESVNLSIIIFIQYTNLTAHYLISKLSP